MLAVLGCWHALQISDFLVPIITWAKRIPYKINLIPLPSYIVSPCRHWFCSGEPCLIQIGRCRNLNYVGALSTVDCPLSEMPMTWNVSGFNVSPILQYRLYPSWISLIWNSNMVLKENDILDFQIRDARLVLAKGCVSFSGRSQCTCLLLVV